MIEPKVLTTKLYPERQARGMKITVPPNERNCYQCGSSENILGWESRIDAYGVMYIWFWCREHKEQFESEIAAVQETHDTMTAHGNAIKYLAKA